MNAKILPLLVCVAFGAAPALASTHHANGTGHRNHGGSNGATRIGSGTHGGGYVCSGCWAGHSGGNPAKGTIKTGHGSDPNKKRH
jgi:hypothetical protein